MILKNVVFLKTFIMFLFLKCWVQNVSLAADGGNFQPQNLKSELPLRYGGGEMLANITTLQYST